jgi:hypothetical protein
MDARPHSSVGSLSLLTSGLSTSDFLDYDLDFTTPTNPVITLPMDLDDKEPVDADSRDSSSTSSAIGMAPKALSSHPRSCPVPKPPTLVTLGDAVQSATNATFMLAASRIQYARQAASIYLLHRLNQPVLETDTLDHVQLGTFDKGSGLVCYPIRIDNVDVGSSDPMTTVSIMLNLAEQENWGEILVISTHAEVDGTFSVHIGFRYVEDAVIMWCRHGKLLRGRHWNIAPMPSVQGICFITRKLTDHRIPVYERHQRLQLCRVLEERAHRSPDLPSPRLAQLQDLITRLALDPGLASMQLPTVDDALLMRTSTDLLLDDRSNNLSSQLSPSLQERMHMRIGSLASNWTSSPLPPPTANSFYRYQSMPYSPPPRSRKVAEQAKNSKARQKHRRQRESDKVKPNASQMSSRQENLAKRTTRHLANVKYAAWNSSTIPLPSVPEKNPGDVCKAEQELLEIWLWYDEALDIVRQRFEQTGLSSLPGTYENSVSRVIAESFYAAECSFSPESRFHNVFGPLHAKIMRMVEEHRTTAQCKLTRVFREQTELTIYQQIQVNLMKDLNLSHILLLLSRVTMLCLQTRHLAQGTEHFSSACILICKYMLNVPLPSYCIKLNTFFNSMYIQTYTVLL